MTQPPSHRITQPILRHILPLATLVLLSATVALAQGRRAISAPKSPAASSLVDSLHYNDPKFTNWDSLAQISPSGKLFVIMLADPTHRHTCRVPSFTADQLTCKAHGARTYNAQDVAALIVPGEYDLRRWFLVGFNGAVARQSWATVVLAPTCVPCAPWPRASQPFGISALPRSPSFATTSLTASCISPTGKPSTSNSATESPLVRPHAHAINCCAPSVPYCCRPCSCHTARRLNSKHPARSTTPYRQLTARCQRRPARMVFSSTRSYSSSSLST